MTVPLFAFAALFLPQDPPPAARSLEVFPLRQLCAPADTLRPPRFGTLLRETERTTDLLGVDDGQRQFDPDQADSLVRLLHSVECESEACVVSIHGESMFVWADAALLAKVRAELKEVHDLLARPITLDAHVFAWAADEPPPAVLGPKEFAQFLQGKPPQWSGSAVTRSNRTALLEASRSGRYVADVYLEIAQKSISPVPLVETWFEGLSLAVVPHALAGSQDLVLHAQLAFGRRRGEPKAHRTGQPDQGSIDAPLLETATAGFSGRVASGGALLVGCAGSADGGPRFVLALSPRYATAVANPVVGRVAILPISALTSQSLSARQPPLPPVWNWSDGEQGEREERFGRFDSGLLVEIVRDALGPARESNDLEVRTAGGFLFAKGAPEQLAAIEQALRGLQDRALQTVEVRAAVRLAEAQGDDPLAAAAATPNGAPSETATAALHTVALPTLLGREATLVRAVETAIVGRFEARTAQEAHGLDPQVERHARQLWLCSAVTPAAGDALHADLLLRVDHGPDAPMRTVDPAAMLAVPSVASALCTRFAETASGRTVDLGAGPAVTVDERSFRTALQATFSRR